MDRRSAVAGTDIRQRISRGIVNLYKSQFGRGPTSARTFINDNVVTIVLHDTLTHVERTLVAKGQADVVSNMRDGFQDAICEEAERLIERETGRNVAVFMSGHSIEPDYAIECFVLDPPGTPEGETSACADRKTQRLD
jgi:uncharacterized protein YbcI